MAYPLILSSGSLGTSVNTNNLRQVLAYHTEPRALASVLLANPGETATGKLVGRVSEFEFRLLSSSDRWFGAP